MPHDAFFASLATVALVAASVLAACQPAPPQKAGLPASAQASTLGQLARAGGGDRLVYVRSDLMPLSDTGIGEIAEAARRLDLPLHVLDAAELHAWLDEGREARGAAGSARDSTARALIGLGGTAHFPALVVRRRGRPVGHAILGYRTAAAYREMIARRLAGGGAGARDGGFSGLAPPAGARPAPAGGEERQRWKDLEVEGEPGAYFRWIRGTRSIAFEMGETIHLLDLDTGARSGAPGWVDLVPSPDGRIFVTPARDRGGLEFYDVEAVRRAARAGEGAGVRPVYTDPRMRDQYPSVGLLRTEETGWGPVAVYRVLTSWFDRAVFRDYRVRFPGDAAGDLDVRPAGDVVPACRGREISLPILSPVGDELGARDEASGSTKLFRLRDGGGCAETLDLGIPSGKVAFGPAGTRVAFAVPRGAVRDARGPGYFRIGEGDGPALEGVWVLDRERRRLALVPGSREARRLAIPEFVGGDTIAFLLAGDAPDGSSRFRIVAMGRE